MTDSLNDAAIYYTHPYGDIEQKEYGTVLRFQNTPSTPPVERLPKARGLTTFEVINTDIQDLERFHEALGAYLDDYHSEQQND